jgi:hypothetical protein
MKDKYILIDPTTLYRVESRYKNAYGYRKVAEKHAQARYDREMRNYRDYQRKGWNKGAAAPVKAQVVSTAEYAEMIKGKGEWRQPIMGEPGARVWVPFDTPACCDPSTETYASM